MERLLHTLFTFGVWLSAGILSLALQCHSQEIPSPNSGSNRHLTEAQYHLKDKINNKQDIPLQPIIRAAKVDQNSNQHEPILPFEISESTGREKREKKLPKVEQYLKEVAPTTKTFYEPSNYQAESQLLPLYEQYIIETSKPIPVAQNILAIQNAILARENAIYEQRRADQLHRQLNSKPDYKVFGPEKEVVYYTDVQYGNEPTGEDHEEEEQEEEDDTPEDNNDKEDARQQEPPYEKKSTLVPKAEKTKTPNREIVYYHNVEYNRESGDKQPQINENNKPKPAPAEKDDEPEEEEEPEKEDEEQEEEEEEEKEGEAEPEKPAPPKFQAKLPESIRKKVFLPTEAGLGHLYQPQDPDELPEYTDKPAKRPKEQIYVSNVKYHKNIVYKPGQQPEEALNYFIEPEILQYQLESAPAANYLPHEKVVGYWQPSPNKDRLIQAAPKKESFQKYKTDVAQYHQVPATKASKPTQIVAYVLVPQTPQPSTTQQQQNYQYHHYPAQQQQQVNEQQGRSSAYLGPTDEEYQQSHLKQKLGRNSSLRVLKTGKPVVFVGHEE